METLSLEQVKAYQDQYKVVPVGVSLYADSCTPIEVLRTVKHISSHCYILESMEDSQRWGRYTFIGYDPQMGIFCKDGTVTLKTGAEVKIHTDHPEQLISQILADNKAPRLEDLPPFTGGLVGYFSYDFIKYAEPSLKLNAADDDGFNDFDLMLFDKVIVFDNLKQQMYLIVNVRLDGVEENYHRAMLELQRMEDLIRYGEKAPAQPLQLKSDFKPLFNEQEYCEMVEKGKHYIREGDIFQVVLANRLQAEPKAASSIRTACCGRSTVAVHVLLLRRRYRIGRFFTGNADPPRRAGPLHLSVGRLAAAGKDGGRRSPVGR